MAAQIPGFEYDIFISYRQKDNLPSGGHGLSDGWVTAFVRDLKKELAATFKEQVSVYFDLNSDDALLETHDVHESLANKLQCLVFIPIISQTYCDPGSYAWTNEFIAFKEIASKDAYGLKVRLPNGNVASRILPVRIHELDAEDRALLETEIGPLRSVDFIYRSQGVNRPLIATDKKEDNLNHYYYRDQLNKVANAIKEIAVGAKSAKGRTGALLDPIAAKQKRLPKWSGARRIISLSLVGLALVATAMLIIRPDFLRDAGPGESLDRSIAVLPFHNLSKDPEQEYFSDGITIGITNALSNIHGLKVAGQTSAFQFKGKTPDLKEIGDKLGVRNILEGSVQKQGNQIRITVQLFDISDGHNIWSERFDRSDANGFAIQDEIASAVTSRFMKTVGDAASPAAIKYTPVQEAYDFYLKGLYYWNKRGDDLFKGLEYFKQSAAADSLFPLAFAGIAQSYVLIGRYGLAPAHQIMPLCMKAAENAIRLDDKCVEAYTALAYEKMIYEWNWEESERIFKAAIDINPNYAPAHYLYGQYLAIIKDDFANAKLQERRAMELEPLSPIPYAILGDVLSMEGNQTVAIQEFNKALELDRNSIAAMSGIANNLKASGNYDEAIKSFLSAAKKIGRKWFLAGLCETYAAMGSLKEAEKTYQEVLTLSGKEYVSPLTIASCAIALKKNKEGIAFLQDALEHRTNGLEGIIKHDPGLASIFKELQSSH